MQSCDTIIGGGGTNGLACAARLAQAGQSVLVLEAAAIAGGGAGTVEFATGYWVSGLAHLVNVLGARVMKNMNLSVHGLEFTSKNLSSTALSSDGNHLTLEGAAGEVMRGDIAQADRAAWAALRTRLMRFARALAPFRAMTPPRLVRGVGNEYLRLMRHGYPCAAWGAMSSASFCG